MRKFVSQRVEAVPPSGIRKFFDIAATMHDVISLGIGEPDFTTPERILNAGIASLRRGDTHYTSNSGTVEMRRALSAYLLRLYGIEYDPERELLVTVGVSEALYLAMTAVLDVGDEVIVPEPCYVAYTAEVVFAGGVPVTVPTSMRDNFQVQPEAIEAAITPKTKALLIGYPNNPTGAVMDREGMLKIAALAEKHDLLVFSDEIYDRLVYGVEHIHFPTLPGMRERTIALGGFSKSHAMTGWRIGYAAAPAELLSAMRKVHQYTIMSAPTIGQAAALEAMQHAEEDVALMLAEYDRRRKLIVGGFNELGLTCFEPRGAFYAFPNITGTGLQAKELQNLMLEKAGVATVAGTSFGVHGEGYIRFSYANSLENIRKAVDRIGNLLLDIKK
jgi:aminotransferase